jgi:hypothetical protein
VSAIGHFLEDEGIATASISLIRLHTETMRPPRALWVPFEMGRPMGAPHESALQTRVLQSVLGLLERTDGPVILDDFEEDAPRANEQETDGMFCPLPIQKKKSDQSDSVENRVREEMRTLSPWYELAVKRNHGRTTVGASAMTIEESLQFLNDLSHGDALDPQPGQSLGQTMRLAAEDLRSWFTEARVSQPGANPNSQVLADWFWGETAAGQLLLDLYSTAIAHADLTVQKEGRNSLVPRNQQHRLK